MANFAYSPMFPTAEDKTEYELISSDHVRLVEIDGEKFLRVDPAALTQLAERAFADISPVSYTHLTLPTILLV